MAEACKRSVSLCYQHYISPSRGYILSSQLVASCGVEKGWENVRLLPSASSTVALNHHYKRWDRDSIFQIHRGTEV